MTLQGWEEEDELQTSQTTEANSLLWTGFGHGILAWVFARDLEATHFQPFPVTGGRLQYGGWNAAIPECGHAKQWLPSRALSGRGLFWSTCDCMKHHLGHDNAGSLA